MRKLSIAITDELDDALESIATAQGLNKSRAIENYLREHKVVRHYIDIVRSEPEKGVLAVSHRAVDELRRKSRISAKTSA